jgi:immune inhibitor A
MGKPITDITENIDGTITFNFSNTKIPTGISQHQTSTPRKIYSITGQYMGTDLKKLPQGVYKVK